MFNIRSFLGQKTVEMLVLHFLLKEDMRMFQVSDAINKCSNGSIILQEDDLYPVFYTLLESGCITLYNVWSNKRNIMYYRIEEIGKIHYQKNLKDCAEIADSISQILKATP